MTRGIGSAPFTFDAIFGRRYGSVDAYLADVSPEGFIRALRLDADAISVDEELLKLGSALTLNMSRRYDVKKISLEQDPNWQYLSGLQIGLIKSECVAHAEKQGGVAVEKIWIPLNARDYAIAAETTRIFGVDRFGELEVGEKPSVYFTFPTGDMHVLPFTHMR